LRCAELCAMRGPMPKSAGALRQRKLPLFMLVSRGAGLNWTTPLQPLRKGVAGCQKILLTRIFRCAVFGISEAYGRLLEPAAAELARSGSAGRSRGTGFSSGSRFELREKARSTMPSNIGISESEGTGC